MIKEFVRRPTAVVAGLVAALGLASAASAQPHNLIIFVADGLRSHIVSPQTAPALAQLRSEGVDFQNSHSLFPTVTTANASAIATGHLLGDTGDFGNTIYAGKPFPPPFGSPTAAIEDDVMLGLLNARFEGNYLGEVSLLQAARAKGYATAVVGKEGPVGVQDVTARDGATTIIIDDSLPDPEGIKLSPEIRAAIKAAGLPTQTPDRGLNAWGGAYNMPGVIVANVEQQAWFADVATKVLIPRFKAQGKPFILIFWSRDPDGTQHDQGDSLNTLSPGINGPTTMAAIRNVSNNLKTLRDALEAQGLTDSTDILVTADHGFSTMTRQSTTSAAAKHRYPDVVPGFVPPGFFAIDMADALGLPLHDGAGLPVDPAKGFYPKRGALLGADPANPDIVIAPNGGAELIYLPTAAGKALAPRIAEFLSRQDYTGAIFAADALGPIPGALPTSRINMAGSARTPAPSMVVSFKSFAGDCGDPEICGVEFADSSQQQGQGIHGTIGRQDTHNFMAAVGPDFRKGYVDPAPVSNADWAQTLAKVLDLDLHPRGHLLGRVMSEALAGAGEPQSAQSFTVRSTPTTNGFVTILNGQTLDGETYIDAAGAEGRAIGLKP